jgi:transglutaminase-like putative cysteine protease
MRPVLLLALVAAWTAPAGADELRLDAKALHERSVTRDVRLTAGGTAVELEEGELFEDDGPAAGFSYRPNEERLSEKVWVKKELVVPNPAARKATLLVGPGGDLKATVNGTPVESKPAGKAGNYWQANAIPPDVLKAGTNSVVLHGSGRVWIARAEDFAAGSTDRPKHPGRSARSTDGGKTWAADRLGPSGDVSGEYCVRLFLDHYRPTGVLTLPVLDAGNLHGRAVAPPLAKPIPVRVRLDADHGRAGRVRLLARSGTTPAPNAAGWSAWESLDAAGELRDPRGRFFQVVVEVATDDPLESPRVKALGVETAPPKGDDWSAKLRNLESDNAEIVRTSIPFTYEPFDHPRLKELRARHKLDEVVKGAKTEFELIERLARWSAGCWDRGHLKDAYPPWDALEILKPHADGTPTGGFCQQYNVVFLQACESFGIPGRAVSIGVGDHGGTIRGSGHEVVELWSNDHRKWVYVDGNFAWYAVDAQTGVPLSLWELRDRQLRVLGSKPAAPVRVVHLLDGGKRWEGLDGWPAVLELRLIPRSNFLQEKSPLPLNQGMRGWFWTGHFAWTDADYPASLLYGQRVSDRRNWEWTLNQARLTLEATATPGELRVHLDTETPGFDAFLADTDGTGPKPVRPGFLWKLHAGKNRFEVRARNAAGRAGIASRVVIECP